MHAGPSRHITTMPAFRHSPLPTHPFGQLTAPESWPPCQCQLFLPCLVEFGCPGYIFSRCHHPLDDAVCFSLAVHLPARMGKGHGGGRREAGRNDAFLGPFLTCPCESTPGLSSREIFLSTNDLKLSSPSCPAEQQTLTQCSSYVNYESRRPQLESRPCHGRDCSPSTSVFPVCKMGGRHSDLYRTSLLEG